MWYSLAYDHGYEQAAPRVERVGRRLDPDQRREAQALPAAWQRDNGAR
jgi:hypothetical protein